MENGTLIVVEHWPVPDGSFCDAYVTGPMVVPAGPQSLICPGICDGGVPEEPLQLANDAAGMEANAVGDAGLQPAILSEHGSLLFAWRAVAVGLVFSVASNDPK